MNAVEAQANWKKPAWWARMALWAVVGGVIGFFGARFVLEGGRELSGSTVFALVTGLLYFIPGVMVLAGSLSPSLGVTMKMFDDRDEWEDERAMMVNSGLGCLFMTAFLFAMLAVEPLSLVDAQTGLAVIAITFAAAALFTWRTWVQMDELWRKVTAEATIATFYLVFTPGAAWSALAHLGLVPPLAPIDWISLFLFASLIGSVIATARRGMIKDR